MEKIVEVVVEFVDVEGIGVVLMVVVVLCFGFILMFFY